jgi:hypothetical protein
VELLRALRPLVEDVELLEANGITGGDLVPLDLVAVVDGELLLLADSDADALTGAVPEGS